MRCAACQIKLEKAELQIRKMHYLTSMEVFVNMKTKGTCRVCGQPHCARCLSLDEVCYPCREHLGDKE